MNDDQIMLIIHKYADIIINNNILNIQIFRKNPSNGILIQFDSPFKKL